LEHLQAALRAAQSAGDLKEQLTTIARQLGYFGYLAYDAVVWVCARHLRTTNTINLFPHYQANAIKFIALKPETSQRVQKISNRFWLAGILFSLTHGILKVSFQHVLNMIGPHGINSSLWAGRPLDQRDTQNPRSGREKYR
jgi:peroxin-11B